jgi:xanthine dehydrogenase accessory factor
VPVVESGSLLPLELRPLALVKGAGDLATGVALKLREAGFSVVMTETPQPTVVRRTVAFAQAVYEGRATVHGVDAVLVTNRTDTLRALRDGNVAVVVDPAAFIRSYLLPDLLVDAIMAKRNLGTHLEDAPAVVGLGPGFVAGVDVHSVIETMRGPTLGTVISQGGALPDTGIPAERNGFGRERVLRSPGEGLFVPVKDIGDRVQTGETVGLVGGTPVISELDGVLRGLLNPGLRVDAGFKLGDVDPGAQPADCSVVSDKALAIGRGVVRAALSLLATPCDESSNVVRLRSGVGAVWRRSAGAPARRGALPG